VPDSHERPVIGAPSVGGKCRNIIGACPYQFLRREMASLRYEAGEAFRAILLILRISCFCYSVCIKK
jgi:hypothetical protein